MATLLEKIKGFFGFMQEKPAYHYTIDPQTEDPVKSYEVEESLSSQEAAVDTKDDGVDLSAMTKNELLAFGRGRGIAVVAKMKKQELIDTINAAL